jgi:hypothetical protein
MRSIFFLLSLIFFGFNLEAAELKDVRVLEVRYKSEKVILKLQDPSVGKESFFYVHLVPEDRLALQKMSLAIKKFKDKKNKLDLEIVSFSPKPSGGTYMSLRVNFKMQEIGEFVLLP